MFIALTQTIGGALQGMGKVYQAAGALLSGAIVKYISNYILVGIPEINIMGAAYSAILCYLVAFTVNFTVLRRNIKLDLNIGKYVIKPVISVIVMGICAYYTHFYLVGIVGMKIATVIAIGVAVAVYAAMLLLLKTFGKDEVEMLPFLKKFIKVK